MSPTASVGRSVMRRAPAEDRRRWLRSRPACSARSRSASSRPTPRRAITIAVLTLPPAASSTARDSSAAEAGGLHQDPLAPVHQLVVPGPQVHHEVAVDLAEPDHRPGGEGVEHELGGGARLHPGRAGDDLGTDRHGDADVAGLAQQRAAAPTGDEDGPGAERLRPGRAPPARRAWCRWPRCRRPRRWGRPGGRPSRPCRRSTSSSAPSIDLTSAGQPAGDDARRPSPAACRTSAGTPRRRARRAGRWCRRRRRSAGRRRGTPPR